MDDSLAIAVEIDEELMSIVPEYLENRRHDCEQIEVLLQQGRIEEIKTLAHRMKGSGGSYGFDEISEIGEALELAAQESAAVSIRSAVVQLGRYLDRVTVTYVRCEG